MAGSVQNDVHRNCDSDKTPKPLTAKLSCHGELGNIHGFLVICNLQQRADTIFNKGLVPQIHRSFCLSFRPRNDEEASGINNDMLDTLSDTKKEHALLQFQIEEHKKKHLEIHFVNFS